MRLIDSHAHLQSDPFEHDRDETIECTRAAGIERLLVPGWDAASSEAALALAERWAGPEWGIDAAAGIHPHDAGRATHAEWRHIVALAANPKVVGIGETGLDFDRMHSTVVEQVANLRRHLRLAAETGKPAILHCRSAAGSRDAQDLLIAEMRAIRGPAVLHSFSGPVDYAEAALELGAAIAFGGLVFRRGEETSAVVARLVPADRLLVETDSPYLAPPGVPRHSGPGFSGRRNSPEWVRITVEWLAERRGTTPDSIGEGLVTAYDATFRRHYPG
jgi:TatD DNase family protein